MIEAYVPLYRKYRPQSFQDLVGQGHIAQALTNAIRLNKVAHAYLFCGPRGTGKTSTARIFAKSLNCDQGPTETPCGVCPMCEGITRGSALDVIEFDAASNNGVDDAREIIESTQFAPIAGRFKIYIIDEVHMLTTQAFNALLKTLEEPPPNIVFIFATTEVHKVLPTIISRCQRFDFQRITSQDIADRLGVIAESETIAIEPDALTTIARHSRGGLRDAVGLLDQVSVLVRGNQEKVIHRKDVLLFTGTLEEDVLVAMADAIGHQQADHVLIQMQELTHRGVEPSVLLKDLTHHFRNLLIVQACQGDLAHRAGQSVFLDLPESYLEALKVQSSLFAPEEIPQILDRFSSIERDIRHSQQHQLWLEIGLLGVTFRENIQTVRDLEARVSALEAAVSGGVPMKVQGSAHSSGTPLTVPQPTAAYRPAPTPAVSQPSSPVVSSSQENSSKVPVDSPSLVQGEPAVAAVSRPFPPLPTSALAGPTSGSGGTLHEAIVQGLQSPATKGLFREHTFVLRHEGNHVVLGCGAPKLMEMMKRPDKWIHIQKAVEKVLGSGATVEMAEAKREEVAPVMGLPPSPVLSSSPVFTPLSPIPVPEVQEAKPEPAVEIIPPGAAPPVNAPSGIAHEGMSSSAPPFQPEPVAMEMPELASAPVEEEALQSVQVQNGTPSGAVTIPVTAGQPLETPVPEPVAVSVSSQSLVEDEPLDPQDLQDAKKMAIDLFQGRVVEGPLG